MTEAREYLIRKNGYFYRPNRAGYTLEKAAAGLYTRAEADREAAIEPENFTVLHESEVEDAPRTVDLKEQLADLQRQLSEAVERAEKVEGWAKDWHGIVDTICTVLELGTLDADQVVAAVRAKFEKAEREVTDRINHWSELYSAEHHRANAAEAEVARLREALEPLERHVALECYDRLVEGGWEKSERLIRLLDGARAALQGEPKP